MIRGEESREAVNLHTDTEVMLNFQPCHQQSSFIFLGTRLFRKDLRDPMRLLGFRDHHRSGGSSETQNPSTLPEPRHGSYCGLRLPSRGSVPVLSTILARSIHDQTRRRAPAMRSPSGAPGKEADSLTLRDESVV